MKIKLFFASVFFIASAAMQTTAQTTDLAKYLPEKAAMIMDIDGSSLSQKVSWKELMAMKMFDSLLKKAEPGTRKMISDPSETGINFREHLYIVIDIKEGEDDHPGNYVAVYGKVQDENKLTQLIDKAKTKEITRKNVGENKMVFGKDFILGWNKSLFVLHSGTSFFKEPYAKQSPAEKKKELARLEKKCIELLTPHPKNIYETNKHFASLANEKADMRIWIQTDMMNSIRKGKNPLTMLNMGMGDLSQGKYKTATVNFENGKIVSTGYTYYEDEMASLIKKIYADKLNADLIKKLPEGNLMGIFSMSFKPEAIQEFLEKAGVWEEFKKMDEEEKLDPKDLINNLKGDVLMAISMSDEPQEMDEDAPKNPFAGMQIYFAATVKDEKKMNTLIDTIKALAARKKTMRDETVAITDEPVTDTTVMEVPPVLIVPDSLVIMDSLHILQDSLMVLDEEMYRPRKNDMFKDFKPTIKVENGLFLLALNEKHLSKFGTAINKSHDKLIDEYGKYPMLMVVDLKTIMSIALSALKKESNPEDDPEMFQFFEVFDKWVIAGGTFENGGLKSIQEIKFSDPNENSFKQVMKMFDLIFSAITKTKSKNIEIKEN